MSNHPLATRLRESTNSLHRIAERSRLMKRLLGGRLEREAYCRLLRNLHVLYATLEEALERRPHDALIGSLGLPRLYRTPALAADLECLNGTGWSALPVTQSMTEYQSHIEQLGRENRLLLVAHAYVRYMGDLSGGQLLRDIVRKAWGLHGETGTAFFSFSGSGDAGTLKDDFRSALNGLHCNPATEDRIVDEARTAFGFHVRMFEELDGAVATG